ncbi:MAG TPA: contractile injection system protein, VgrG/Pvc8 family [Chloroflexota bacterium]|jgi:phage protein D
MPGPNGADALVRPARPAIAVDGQARSSLGEGLLRLEIVEDTLGLYRCEATFGNWGTVNNEIGYLYFDRSLLEFGKAFAVKLNGQSLFDGRITGLEAHFPEGEPPELSVLAEDRFQDLRMVRRTRSFEDVSDADVVRQVASEHGLTASVEAPGPRYSVLAQVNQSDLAFLRDRARTVDAELWMDGSTLKVAARASRDGGTLRMSYGRELWEFSVLADLAHQRSSLTVSGWDVAAKAGISQQAGESVVQGELNSMIGGASILSRALGERKEAVAHTVPLTSEEAQAEAAALFRLSARRFVVGRGRAEANAGLRVGAYVDLQGLGPLFSGKYYVAQTRTIFDGGRGFRIEFAAERPGLGLS